MYARDVSAPEFVMELAVDTLKPRPSVTAFNAASEMAEDVDSWPAQTQHSTRYECVQQDYTHSPMHRNSRTPFVHVIHASPNNAHTEPYTQYF